MKNGNVLGVIAKSKQDVPYLKQYLTDVVKKTAPSYHVRLFESDEKLISHLQRLTQEEASENSEKHWWIIYIHLRCSGEDDERGDDWSKGKRTAFF